MSEAILLARNLLFLLGSSTPILGNSLGKDDHGLIVHPGGYFESIQGSRHNYTATKSGSPVHSSRNRMRDFYCMWGFR